MITWNRLFFHSPTRYMIEMIVSINDYVILFLFSSLILVLFNIIFSVFCKRFKIDFFENHQLETVWTVSPFVLLCFVVVPSLRFLYMLDTCFFCGISVSVIGHQWYWSYFYKDFKDLFFDSYISSSDNFSLRLIDVDNRVVIPSFLPVRFLVRRADVIHSWAIPSFGLKMDAVPGRINQFCFSSKRSGVFFGQCSEICGANHSFMPIVLECVGFKDFLSSF